MFQVAQRFEKRHADVLRSIRNIMAMPEMEHFAQRNFASSAYADETGKKNPLYWMTKDAFCILAMGYMGPEAMKWKLMFLAAFNSREASALQAEARAPAKDAC